MDLLVEDKSRRVLLVDDDVEVVQVLGELLTILGQEVRCASDGAASLDLARAFSPHVVVLDLDMPGMDGFEVAVALRKIAGLEKVGIFALSGWNDRHIREKCVQHGFDRFFAKPTPAQQILFALSEHG